MRDSLDPPLTDKLRFTSGYQFEDLVDTESKLLTLGGEWHSKQPDGWQRVVSLNWMRGSTSWATTPG